MSSSDEKTKQPIAEDSMENLEAEIEAGEEEILKSEELLLNQIAEAEKKAEENWELLLRAKAEMENLRRRTDKDLENAHKYGIEKLVLEILPVKDSMEMGLVANDVTAESLHEGMKLTMNMLNSVFKKIGIEEINPNNEKFDPEVHEAMTMQPSYEVEPNTVISVMQKGYLLHDRLVRPAMVIVSKKPDDD